ncbi:hypothetical protein [Nonomuraea rhodomycinica]|uniref:Uncharacterized protein n=1 Tax=Nonomuraea rhodomycinica TaxID=1712872 RepID=A0A7Y6ME29_9ACTN|nr:hypothetical protein [Nonomuraea rhodomycinica]NUW44477.1 hypothetical protein [Nonomuraea rhodomycinica]
MSRQPSSPLRMSAAVGLVPYLVGALIARLRMDSRGHVAWAVFFVAAVAVLAVNPGHPNPW